MLRQLDCCVFTVEVEVRGSKPTLAEQYLQCNVRGICCSHRSEKQRILLNGRLRSIVSGITCGCKSRYVDPMQAQSLHPKTCIDITDVRPDLTKPLTLTYP